MANRLEHEKSPYLLQHAHNPVDWYPWGDEAFQKAREENKPVFLSIGYSTCHWCHVMERESFEDEEVAKLLNEHLVAVKVDREERPDVDEIYMGVCQAMTGSGGWPLSIFMTPDRKPFYAATYLPKQGRMGMAGFTDVIRQIARLWREEPERVLHAGDQVTQAIQPKRAREAQRPAGMETLDLAYQQLRGAFDSQWGGFGQAPKFPTPHHLTFLLRYHRRHPESTALSMVEKTLSSMRQGGIFDQVGLGFHRYSVDERWLVPHFEKMLYDQALLAMAYVEAFQVTGRQEHADAAREIFDYVLRDMTDPGGGFYSAEDADSEGEEGLFYVWTPEEVKAVLGAERSDLFCRFHDITAAGNFEHGRSIPHVPKTEEVFARMVGMTREALREALASCRKDLYVARERRAHPLKDDKILTAWNGLMIAALAMGYRAMGDPRLLEAATQAADFIWDNLRDGSGRLLRRFRGGETAHVAYLDDHAYLVWGLLDLYESSFEVTHLERALALNEAMLRLFWDEDEGGFFFTGSDGEEMITRDKQLYDGAVPSGNSVAALNLLRLNRMTGDPALEEKADRLLKRFGEMVQDFPMAYTQFLNAVDFALGPSAEVVLSGDPDDERGRAMLEWMRGRFAPNRVMLWRKTGAEGEKLDSLCGYVGHLQPVGGSPTVYVCEQYACKRPVTSLDELKPLLG
ncbi:MAG: thioredoxin domain-containing protein [Syntrophobacteraceae bacterium]